MASTPYGMADYYGGIFGFKTILPELLDVPGFTNIRIHARLAPSQLISFRAHIENNQLVMVFIDPGCPFDPTTVTSDRDLRLAAKQCQRRGFGITMIKRLANKVGYRRVNGSTNELTVVKQWSN